MQTPSLRERVWAGVDGKCDNVACNRAIHWDDKCWYDRLSDKDYCYQCGLVLRYHRKKALERGEAEPATLADIN